MLLTHPPNNSIHYFRGMSLRTHLESVVCDELRELIRNLLEELEQLKVAWSQVHKQSIEHLQYVCQQKELFELERETFRQERQRERAEVQLVKEELRKSRMCLEEEKEQLRRDRERGDNCWRKTYNW